MRDLCILVALAFLAIAFETEGRYMEHRISSPSRRAYNFADFVSLPLWDEEGAELKPCLPFMDCEKTEAKRRGRFSDFYDVDESPDDLSLINATS